MTVYELIQDLVVYPPDTQVVVRVSSSYLDVDDVDVEIHYPALASYPNARAVLQIS